jgi:hypothetical protein
MPYTKGALLVFGLGLLLGFGLIVAEMPTLALIASGIMALGLTDLTFALVADGRTAFIRRILGRFSRPKRVATRRRAKPAATRIVGRPVRRRSPTRVARRRRR